MGTRRAADGLHPNESLRAAAVLFEVVFCTLFEQPSARELPPSSVASLALALDASISSRIQDAAAAYAGFLLDRIGEAHADERRRIARDIHDRVAQNVVVAERNLSLFIDAVSGGAVRADAVSGDAVRAGSGRTVDPVERVAVARSLLTEALDNIRDVTSDLRLRRPVESLEAAVQTYVASLAAWAIQFELVVNGEEGWLPIEARDQLFLVICEAIRNAVTHASPTTVLVRVDIAPHEVRASVEDDGVGFDTGTARDHKGTGLVSMRERVELLGGDLTIDAAAGGGARIDVLVPLRATRRAGLG